MELTVDAFYKFNVVKSWTYEGKTTSARIYFILAGRYPLILMPVNFIGDYVVLELKSKTGLDDKYKFKASTEEYACEVC